MDKKLVYDNNGVKIYIYSREQFQYREIHVGGKIITVDSISYIGVYVR
jgi:hypothetical protein